MTVRPTPDDWRGAIVLPGRTLIRGRGVQNPLPGGREPDYGLYLGVPYEPDWQHGYVDWPDFGLPRDPLAAVRSIVDLHERARDGELVETACRAGKGRTGTVISCLAILDGLPAAHAVNWVRDRYHLRAVQTPWQRRFVRRFPGLLEAGRQPTRRR